MDNGSNSLKLVDAMTQIWQLLTGAVVKAITGKKLTPRENFALFLAGSPESLMDRDTEQRFVKHIKTNLANPNFKYDTPGKFFASVRMTSK
jgi:hypothetical protein